MIRIKLPYHLRNLAHVDGEVQLEVYGEITIRSLLNTLEGCYPMLAGTIRDHASQNRRPFLRYYVCGEDWSLEPQDTLLPDKIRSGEEPFLIIGAIAGG